MRVTYRGGVQPGDCLMIGGWVILVADGDRDEYCGGMLPSHRLALDAARSLYRGRSWRLAPVSGHVQSHNVVVDATGKIDMVVT